MGQIQWHILPAREVERLRGEAEKPSFAHAVNTKIGFGLAGVAEAVRPSVKLNTVRGLKFGAFVSICASAGRSAYLKRAEFADWHGMYRRLEMWQIWHDEFITNIFGQMLFPCLAARLATTNAVIRFKGSDKFMRKTAPGLIGLGVYIGFGYPFYHYAWKPLCDRTLSRFLQWFKEFLCESDDVPRRPGITWH